MAIRYANDVMQARIKKQSQEMKEARQNMAGLLQGS